MGLRPLAKIDVEGGAPLTFQGMQQVLALKPDIVLETFSQKACDIINAMVAPLGYVFKILELEGQIERQDCRMPADARGNNFNQVLTTRNDVQLAHLLS